MTTIGYARCSTEGQSIEGQLAALRAAGAERVFSEKISGAKTDRKALAKALAALGPGDVLLVSRLDRLARRIPPSNPCCEGLRFIASWTLLPLMTPTISGKLGPDDSGCWGQFRLKR